MTTSLAGKIALVTGASRGIGAAIADTLAQAGATVIGTATSESGASAIAQTPRPVERHRAHAQRRHARQRGSADCRRGKRIRQTGYFGEQRGHHARQPVDAHERRRMGRDYEREPQIRLSRRPKAVLRGMMKQRAGRIITITSVVGTMGNAGQTNYAAAKAALQGFSKSLAREVGSRGITVNCVAPGFIDTDMTRALPEETRKAFEAQTALGCFGTPQDIADAVLFLASDQARYITGQTLHVNGGMLMP